MISIKIKIICRIVTAKSKGRTFDPIICIIWQGKQKTKLEIRKNSKFGNYLLKDL